MSDMTLTGQGYGPAMAEILVEENFTRIDGADMNVILDLSLIHI